MELHVYLHFTDPPTHTLLQTLLHKLEHLPALMAGLEHRLGDRLMETAETMKAAYDELRTNVANELQQFADILAQIQNAGANQAAIDEVTAGMRDLNAKLVADDPITPAP